MEPEPRTALIAQLSSAEEEERRRAMEALKEDLSDSDLEWLTRPLSDESWRVRKEAIEGVSMLAPTPELVASLVPLMHPERELTLRNSVVEVLERIGSDAAMLLVPYLTIDQADVRKFLVDILGNIADPGSVPALVELLKDRENNIKAAAAEALASIGDTAACGKLSEAMAGADDWVVYSLLGSLARLRCHEALSLFFEYLDSPLLYKPAMDGIGAMGSPADGTRLMTSVPSLSKGAQKAAFLAAGSIFRRHASHEAIDPLRELRTAAAQAADDAVVQFLGNQLSVTDDLDDRKDILAALGMIGGGASLPPILDLVEDEALAQDVSLALFTVGLSDEELVLGLLDHHDPLVRQRAIGTLERLGKGQYLPRLYDLLSDESGHVRKDAANAVASLGDRRSVDRLLPLLEDEYSDVAQSAAQALVRLGLKAPADLAEKIVPMLHDAPAGLNALLVRILTEVRAPDWEEICLRAAQDTNPEVRAAAVSSLRFSDRQAAAATIINSLADEDPQVRVQAAIALEESGDEEALAPLKAALHDQDPWVRAAAMSSLSLQPGAVPEDFAGFLAGEDLMMRSSAVDALGRMAASGRPGAMEMIEDQFMAGSVEIKRNICRLLGKVGDPRAEQLLRRAAGDVDPSIRVFALQSLARLGGDGSAGLLTEAAEKDPDKQVREAARSIIEGMD